jgi:hypothetical protein
MTANAVRVEEILTSTPKTKRKAKTRVRVTVKQKRVADQLVACLGASFLPVASYMLAHYEAVDYPALWTLVTAALLFSAPSVATWAQRWTGSMVKAWGFSILLDGTLVFSHIQWLSLTGLGILVVINALAAWQRAAKCKA